MVLGVLHPPAKKEGKKLITCLRKAVQAEQGYRSMLIL